MLIHSATNQWEKNENAPCLKARFTKGVHLVVQSVFRLRIKQSSDRSDLSPCLIQLSYHMIVCWKRGDKHGDDL
jgi:hypothetical protein